MWEAYGRLRILGTIIHSIKVISVLSSNCNFLQKIKSLSSSFIQQLSFFVAAILFHFIFLIIYF